jgi:hypothetical protein
LGHATDDDLEINANSRNIRDASPISIPLLLLRELDTRLKVGLDGILLPGGIGAGEVFRRGETT